MAPGFGSGLAHALTAGVTGYGQGEEENRRALFVLAAQRRAEARQKQQDELQRIGALTAAANAGMDVTPADTGRVAPAGAPPGAPTPAPDAGPSGPPLGTINGMQVRVPAGGVVGKAARDDAAKQSQRTADLVRRAGPLNAKLPDGHPYKLTDEQLAGIAADPSLYNEWAKGALGITKDPIATHKANRDYDVAHPTRETGENTSWQTVTTQDGSMVQVNPKTGATRPIGIKARPTAASVGASGQPTTAMRNKAAEAAQTITVIDEALGKLKSHPQAVGFIRGIDAIDQRVDKGGVDARAAMASVSSQLLHALSGAAVSPSEYARLRQYVPTSSDSYEAAVTKLTRLKGEMERLHTGYSGGQTAGGGPTPPSPNDPGGNLDLSNAALTAGQAQGATEDQRLWDAAVAKHGKDRVLKEYGARP